MCLLQKNVLNSNILPGRWRLQSLRTTASYIGTYKSKSTTYREYKTCYKDHNLMESCVYDLVIGATVWHY